MSWKVCVKQSEIHLQGVSSVEDALFYWRTPSNIKLFVVRHGIFLKPISKLYFSQSGIVTAADTSSPPDLFNVLFYSIVNAANFSACIYI